MGSIADIYRGIRVVGRYLPYVYLILCMYPTLYIPLYVCIPLRIGISFYMYLTPYLFHFVYTLLYICIHSMCTLLCMCIHSICTLLRICILLAVSHTVFISIRIYYTLYVFHSVCRYSIPCVLYSKYTPLRICIDSVCTLSSAPYMCPTFYILLYVYISLRICIWFRIYLILYIYPNLRVYPTLCVFYSICISLFLCVYPIPYVSIRIIWFLYIKF